MNCFPEKHLVIDLSTVAPTTTTTVSPCSEMEFHCVYSGECIPLEGKCDGKVVHCEDKSDERDCRCVDYLKKDPASVHKVGDGILDCADKSDEHDSEDCQEGRFVCSGHQSQCIEVG